MSKTEKLLTETKARFLQELRHHFKGWFEKISESFSEESFKKAISELENDPVYKSFCFAIPEYALIRLMGRVSISIGRRLGEIYDKIPRFVTQARFDLTSDEVCPLICNKLQLDVCVPIHRLSITDKKHLKTVITKHVRKIVGTKGLAIEIRYNFNPNDSARLRKDVDMIQMLMSEGYLGVYLIFSTISPRDEAIARLKRAGWAFLVGDNASKFIYDLIGLDLGQLVNSPEVQKEIREEVSKIMTTLFTSYAFQKALLGYSKNSL